MEKKESLNADEIEKIMSEIEQLQEEMSSAIAPKPKPAAQVAAPLQSQLQANSPAHPLTPPSQLDKEQVEELSAKAPKSSLPEKTTPGVDLSTAAGPVEMKELSSQSQVQAQVQTSAQTSVETPAETDEPWLEETLSTLKAESNKLESPTFEEPINEDQLPEGNLIDAALNKQPGSQSEASCMEAPRLKAVSSQLETDDEAGIIDRNSLTQMSTLAMSIEGSMSIRLNFGNDGQCLLVTFRDQLVQIQLPDGFELKIPVRKKVIRTAA
jgi:hypothetical protein